MKLISPSGGGASTPLPNLIIPLLFKLPQISPRPIAFLLAAYTCARISPLSALHPQSSIRHLHLHPPVSYLLSPHIPTLLEPAPLITSSALFHHGAYPRRDGH
jgi:hypothetical protein